MTPNQDLTLTRQLHPLPETPLVSAPELAGQPPGWPCHLPPGPRPQRKQRQFPCHNPSRYPSPQAILPSFLQQLPRPNPASYKSLPCVQPSERDGTARAPHPEREACSGSPVATNLFKKHKQLMPESKSISKTNDGVKSSILCANPSEPLNFCLHFKSRRERCLPPDAAPSQEHRPPPAQRRSALRRPLGSSRKRQRVFPGLKSRRPVPCAG